MADKQYYPMIPELSWWTLREQFKKTVPSVVSVSYLKSLLSLTSDQSAKNLQSPLRQMKIIDENNKPTSRANDWRTDAQYLQVCENIVSEIYPPELNDLFPDEVDVKKAADWFMHTGQVGESAAKKLTSTYSLLKNGRVKNSEELSKSPRRTTEKKETQPKVENRPSKTENKKNTTDSQSGTTNNNIAPPPNIETKPHQNPTIHIDLQVHISPEATAQQIDNIFSSISKHLYNKS